ncbi:MAG: hypothetical protein SGCHY_004183 [Lobulomycetales sp.]
MGDFISSFAEKMALDEQEMKSLFLKIDTDLDGIISWDDFSNFMLLRAEGEKSMKEEAESHLFNMDTSELHRYPLQTPHRDAIGKIIYVPSLKRYITIGKDGIICYYSEHLKLVRKFRQDEYVFFEIKIVTA